MNVKILSRIQALHNKALNARRICYTPGCTNYAQNSHILQKNGILNFIADNGFIRQLDSSSNNLILSFKKAGINSTDVMAFPGFCNSCDTKVFLPIESNKLDFDNYKHLLLYTYRAIVCELHKVDAWLTCCNKIAVDTWYDESIRNFFEDMKVNYQVIKNAFTHQQFLIGNNLFNDSSNSAPTFTVFRVPRQDIACSAVHVPYMELDEELTDKFLNTAPESYDFPFFHKAIYIHSIPTDKELIIVIGYHKDVNNIETVPIKELSFISEEAVLLVLGTILVKRIETWSISERLYQEWFSTEKGNHILSLRRYYFDETIEDKYMYDLFSCKSKAVGRYLWGGFSNL